MLEGSFYVEFSVEILADLVDRLLMTLQKKHKLEKGILLNETNFNRFVMILKSAGLSIHQWLQQ